MNHLFTRAGGIWADDTDLLHLEMADIDAKTVDSISATGGVYALVDELQIGGAPGTFVQIDVELDVTAPAQFADSMFVLGDADFAGVNFFMNVANASIGNTNADQLTVNSLSDFLGFARFDGGASFFDVATFNDVADFNDRATFNDEVDFEALVIFDSIATFNDEAHFNGDTHFGGTVTLGVPLSYSSSGRVPQRQTLGADVDQSFGPTGRTHVIVMAGVLSADRVYTISDVGAIDGDRIRFTNLDATWQITVAAPGGGILSLVKRASTFSRAVEAERVSGSWVIVGTMP